MSLAVVATPTSAAMRSSSSSSQSSSSMRERSKSPATRRNQVRRVRSRAAVVFSSACGERPKCLNRCYLLGPGGMPCWIIVSTGGSIKQGSPSDGEK
jgi:hypothetical protein